MISGKDSSPRENTTRANNNSVIESLVSGSISSTLTTIVYQPLDLLKTRIQLRDNSIKTADGKTILLGRITKSALTLVKHDGLLCLWKGTGASLLRSCPGVGLYYATLTMLQTNYSSQTNRPNDAVQAFYFGLMARSMVSFMLLPVTVVKVRYESGRFNYPSLIGAIGAAYTSSSGWVGLVPTVLRDSIFSGTYYMCYTQLKSQDETTSEALHPDRLRHHMRLFSYGVMSGFVASFITNPIDVLKTAIQAASNDTAEGSSKLTMRQVASKMLNEPKGFFRFFDGLIPRSARRTLITASTWTFYELLIDLMHFK
uniref:Solute carrier family 25 member 38 n=1 Tax=Aceria tosichella TaxID=561515 RepID=A0A6G1SD11_9ACAR